ncbi:MAG: TIR domain-containing protein [Planctomycetes bacterium]|nr:TIR domain-containing protein [Planctomycetota bacterium]
MGHDVFVSHSSLDKPTADAVVATLEARKIRCWIAPRDILPGADWSESIVDAIHGSRVMVLVFSDHANASPQIKREVERAVNRSIPIIPMRIENVMPTKSLEYFISTPHWLDAFNPPLQQHLNVLGDTVERLLSGKTPKAPPMVIPTPTPWYVQHIKSLAITAAVIIALILLLIIALRGPGKNDGGSAPVATGNGSTSTAGTTAHNTSGGSVEQQGIKAFAGQWRMLSSKMDPEMIIPGIPTMPLAMGNTLLAAWTGPEAHATLDIQPGGLYTLSIDVQGQGTYTPSITPDRFSKNTAAKGFITFASPRTGASDRVEAIFWYVHEDQPHLASKKGDTQMSLMPPGNGAAVTSWVRRADTGLPESSPVGTWQAHQLFIDSYLPYDATLVLSTDGKYTIRFTRVEKGLLDATDGKYQFKRAIAAGPPVQGAYNFDGPDRVTFTEPRGTATWVRVKN